MVACQLRFLQVIYICSWHAEAATSSMVCSITFSACCHVIDNMFSLPFSHLSSSPYIGPTLRRAPMVDIAPFGYSNKAIIPTSVVHSQHLHPSVSPSTGVLACFFFRIYLEFSHVAFIETTRLSRCAN
ncbi:hypothetical protein F5Y07DRAFT_225188 [Xylaria sp. FL0933]|nr:hypothetical protein F5Y07DRAFT_225188 [Xylaria sp. FL0933]